MNHKQYVQALNESKDRNDLLKETILQQQELISSLSELIEELRKEKEE